MRSLLIIGVINATATALALMATAAIDDGQWLRHADQRAGAVDAQAAPADTVYAALIFMVLYAPLQVALWYAPLFAGLHRTPPLKALVFSAVAVWRNKGAFLMYFAGWFAVAVGLVGADPGAGRAAARRPQHAGPGAGVPAADGGALLLVLAHLPRHDRSDRGRFAVAA